MKDHEKYVKDKRLSLICSTSEIMFYEYNPSSNYFNMENVANILGYSQKYLDDNFENNITFLSKLVHKEDIEHLKNMFDINNAKNRVQLRLRCADNEYHTFAFNREVIQDSNDQSVIIGCIWNVDNEYTNISDARSKLSRDEMTGLLTRNSTFSLINEMLNDVLKGCDSAFIFIDIDNFKQINDTYGHPFGDDVIVYIANVIKEHMGPNNIIGRFGGDEFMIFIPNFSSQELVINKVENMMNEIKNYTNRISETFTISISAGITFENENINSLEMFDHADKALYTAKLLGKGQYSVYNAENIINPLDSSIADLYEMNEFFKAVEERLANDTSKYCLAVVSIENHALFNKWYGHQKGRAYMDSVINYLISLESKYKSIFGICGNNKFGILLPNTKKILHELEKGCKLVAKDIGNTVVFLPAIGVYEIDDHKTPANLMFYKAEEVQKRVFNNFDSRLRIYSDSDSDSLEHEIRMILKFKKALEKDELQVFLQPKMDIVTHQIVGAEMLMRWINSDGSIIYPDEFIPILEKYNIIYQADMYCWEKLFKTLSAWKKQGIKYPPVSINISRSDMLSIDVCEYLSKLINKYDIDLRSISVEITETVYTESIEIETIKDTIDKLKKMGFSILMDDFGSGYSSLSILKDLNFDAMKIDMDFLAPSVNTQKGFHILESIVKLAHDIGLPVIVEGVENKDQEMYLKSINCRFSQGYFYYSPMPIKEYLNIITNNDNIYLKGIFGYWEEQKNKEIKKHNIKK